MKRFFLVMIFGVLLLENLNSQLNNNPFLVILPDTSRTHHPNWFYEDVNNFCNELKFQRLDKGFDSICIRIWTTGIAIPFDVIDISYSKKRWIATRTFFCPSMMEETRRANPDLAKTKTSELNLNSPHSFAMALNELNILTVPSQKEIPAFEFIGFLDGFDYIIEVATIKFYKIIQYHSTIKYSNFDDNNKKVFAFLKYVSKNVGAVHALPVYGN